MSKYQVVFSLSYDVEAEGSTDAMDKAETLFVEEVPPKHCGLTEIFDVKARKMPVEKER
jgi:hypothetical protein